MAVARRIGWGLLGTIAGYFGGAFLGYWLIEWFSSNHFDRSVEAAMTAAFFYGPLGAVIGLTAGVIRGGRKSAVKSTRDGARG